MMSTRGLSSKFDTIREPAHRWPVMGVGWSGIFPIAVRDRGSLLNVVGYPPTWVILFSFLFPV